ncbi:MAG: hypothetical protein MJB14_11745 [Spirochaetes bacterium]|nr:hypothetical protein [Spirochaetota bacterium]
MNRKEKIFNFIKKSIVGVWLITLYIFLLWLIVGTLSGYGFQEKISKMKDSEGNVFTVTTIIIKTDELTERQKDDSYLKEAINQKEVEYESSKKNDSQYENQINSILSEMIDLSNIVEPLIRKKIKEKDLPVPVHFELYQVQEYLIMFKDDSDMQDFLLKFEELAKNKRNIEKKRADLKIVLNLLSSTINNLKNKHAVVREQIQATQKNFIGDCISELQYMNTFKYKLFATMPLQLLTLILTITMGALGSLIYISLDFFLKWHDRPFSWFFFRPFLGMVTAIAIFILAKAGQLTISDSKITQSLSENLNPFFISFLGIISGLLSEQAIDRIRTAGQVVFRPKEKIVEPNRWAVGFKQELENQKKDASELEQFVKLPEHIIQDWIEQKRSVPFEEQKIISAWLSVPAYKLFTDIKPDHVIDDESG